MKKKILIVGIVFILEVIAIVCLLLLVLPDNREANRYENVELNSVTNVIAQGTSTEADGGSSERDKDDIDNKDIDNKDIDNKDIENKDIESKDIESKDVVNIEIDIEDIDSKDIDIEDIEMEDDSNTLVNVYDTITISAAGDVTLGTDTNFGYEKSFVHEFDVQNQDYGYFFRNVKSIFEADDLTIVNLETTLTTATKKAIKKYCFKADPSYVEILKQGNIEVVSIANNHTLDYLDKGYNDTLATLEAAEVGYFGNEHRYTTDIRGIKVGVLGYICWEITTKQKDKIKLAIEELKKEGIDIVIVMYHWGIERAYYPNSVQKKMAHFTIDSGADLVLGSHPHVLQGIEEYNGKHIIYSLANFSFGGNRNPDDKDTMIVTYKFNFKNSKLISQEHEVIPCSISSVKDRNNYQPTPLENKERDRVLKKIEKYSKF